MGFTTGNLFSVLGTRALLGRTLLESDSAPGAADVVVLSEGYWRSRFGADPGVVGQTLRLNGETSTVVGVMPVSVQIPPGASLWAPFTLDDMRTARGRYLTVVGRLREGVSLAQARDEMARLGEALAAEHKERNAGWTVNVQPLHADLVRLVRPGLVLLLLAVAVLLLIACVNVANLLLVRATAREREMAIRTALGAGRGRVVRQVLTENILLAGLGAGWGVLLAAWGIDLLRSAGPQQIPRLELVAIDERVLGFTLAITALTWAVFSLWPAARSAALPSLRVVAWRPRSAASRVLVISEMALAALLLIGAGLLVRSFARLLAVDPGYDPKNVLALSLQLPPARYPAPKGWPILEWPQVSRFQEQLLEQAKALPGVESAALGISTPLDGGWTTRMTIAGRPAPPPGQQDEPYLRLVSEDYFRVARIPLRAGRGLTPHDDDRRPKVGLVNESFVRRYFPTENPLDQRVNVYGVERQIVGVVGNEKFAGLGRETPPAMYLPYRQNPLGSMTLIVRTAGDPLALAPALQKRIWSIDRDLAPFDVMSLEQGLSLALAQRRFTMLLLGVFAATALALAAVGLYGVIAYWVSRRTQELGVRMALGASRGEVLRLVVGQGLRLSVVGAALGAAAAFPLARFLKTELFGVSVTDPATFAVVPLVLIAVAAAACYIPARRATRVEPMAALRYE